VDEDLIASLIRLRQDASAGPHEIVPVMMALRDHRLAASSTGQPPREIRLGQRRLDEAIPVLRDFLHDAHMQVLEWACQTLGWLDAREAMPDLLDLLRPEAAAERRIAVPFVFEDWGLSYPDESAMYALQLMKATEAIPSLAALLASESKRTVATAEDTLEAMEAAPYVAGLLARDDARLRDAAAEFLRARRIKAALLPAVEASLLSVLQGEAAQARRAAAGALGRLASIAAVMPLLESLARPDTDAELEAVVRAAIAEIQSRRPGAAPGQLSVADPAAGQLSLSGEGTGDVSLASAPAPEEPGE
jgi:HEAT repeat protein